MYTTIVKKFMGLLAVYAVVIVGIFVLQFKWPAPTISKSLSAAANHARKDTPSKESKEHSAPPQSTENTQEKQLPASPFTFNAFTVNSASYPPSVTSLASKTLYEKTLSSIEDALISSFSDAASSDENVTEADAVAFVASLASRSTLNEAVSRVPPQIRHATYRTYLSAPYFGSLTTTYRFLDARLAECRNTLAALSSSGNALSAIEALGMERMTDYILLNASSAPVISTLKMIAGANYFAAEDAASVLLAYNEIYTRKSEIAPQEIDTLLETAVPKCLDAIEKSIKIDNDTITIANGTGEKVLDAMAAIKVGAALIKMGSIEGGAQQDNSTAILSTGMAIVNEYAKDIEGFSLGELSKLAVLLVSPPQYPHTQILSETGKIYAFTCAKSIEYSTSESGNVMDIVANKFDTHYMIISGIKPFASIYIYSLPYHADKRFETYNTSGFVYLPAANTLLLKSRHKTQNETIRLTYGESATAEAKESE